MSPSASSSPHADAFRNYIRPDIVGHAANAMIDKAQLMSLSAPEVTVLIGGLRVLGGLITSSPGMVS